MKKPLSQKASPVTSSQTQRVEPCSYGDHALGFLACLWAFGLPFFPDEKLVRLKLQWLEGGLLLLLFLNGLRIFSRGTLPWGFLRSSKSGARSEKEPALHSAFRLPVSALPLAVSFWGLVQLVLFALSPDRSVASLEIRRVMAGAVTFLLFTTLEWPDVWKKAFFRTWFTAAALMAVYGVLQFTGGVGALAVPRLSRVMGTFGNPIFFASYLMVSFFIGLAAWEETVSWWGRGLHVLGGTLIGVAIGLTQTRGVWLALAGTLVIGFLRWSKRRPSWRVVLPIVIGVGAFAAATASVWQRDQGHALIWRDTLRMWADHKLTGVGLGAFHLHFPSYAQEDLKAKWPKGQVIVNYAHNEYLQTLAEGGAVGAVAFLLVVVAYLALRPSSSSSRWLWLAGVSLLISNGVSVDMRFTVSFVFFFLLAGLSRSLSTERSRGAPAWFRDKTLRLGLSLFWVILFTGIVYPLYRKPYAAQQDMSRQKDFFDEKLLDPAKTIGDLEEWAKRHPNEPAVWEKLAFAYAKEIRGPGPTNRLDRADQALSAYRRVMELDANRVSAYNNSANIYYTLGRADDALTHWRKAISVDPTFLDAHLNLGKVLYVKGDLQEAARHFQQVLKRDPNNAEARTYLRRMVE